MNDGGAVEKGGPVILKGDPRPLYKPCFLHIKKLLIVFSVQIFNEYVGTHVSYEKFSYIRTVKYHKNEFSFWLFQVIQNKYINRLLTTAYSKTTQLNIISISLLRKGHANRKELDSFSTAFTHALCT